MKLQRAHRNTITVDATLNFMTYVTKQSFQFIRNRKSELPVKKECSDKFNNVYLRQLNQFISRRWTKNKNTHLRRVQIPSLCSLIQFFRNENEDKENVRQSAFLRKTKLFAKRALQLHVFCTHAVATTGTLSNSDDNNVLSRASTNEKWFCMSVFHSRKFHSRFCAIHYKKWPVLLCGRREQIFNFSFHPPNH